MESIRKFDEIIETETKVENGELDWKSDEYREVMQTYYGLNEIERFVFDAYKESKKMNNKHIVLTLDCDHGDGFIAELDKVLWDYEIREIYCFGVFNLNVKSLFELQNRGWCMKTKMFTEKIERYGKFHHTDEAPVIEMYR